MLMLVYRTLKNIRQNGVLSHLVDNYQCKQNIQGGYSDTERARLTQEFLH
jgi:hypothetical protein